MSASTGLTITTTANTSTYMPRDMSHTSIHTVRLADGFVGQVLIGAEIVFESAPKKTSVKAAAAAERAIAAAFWNLFNTKGIQ